MRKYGIRNFIAIAAIALLASGTASAAVVIQEVLYDGPGTDPDDVFTELFGTPGTDLTGWTLAGINGTDGSVYRTIDLSGYVIPDDGIFVIATSLANPDLALQSDLFANVDWQNGPDAVQLLDNGVIVDALQYGDAGLFNAGEGSFAVDVTSGMSLSRDGFGTDTNDNAIDFSAMIPTPGTGPTVVPVPAAVWLFGTGLGLLGFLRRRRGPEPGFWMRRPRLTSQALRS
jgi:opacity protein-like surface antigen